MSNNKQDHIADANKKVSSVDWLESEITKRGPLENNPPQWLKDLYSQAKAMHKEEMIKFAEDWEKSSLDCKEDLYNKTFGGNNEQQ